MDERDYKAMNKDAQANIGNTVLCADWRTIENEKPQYYGLNLCYGNNSMAVCWRASDGDHDIYAIAGTDNIMQNVSHWMPLPSEPICT